MLHSNAVAGLDVTGTRLIVCGGNTSSNSLDPVGTADTYSLDLATNVWSQIDAAGAP